MPFIKISEIALYCRKHQVVQSIERRSLQVEVRDSKPELHTWCWDRTKFHSVSKVAIWVVWVHVKPPTLNTHVYLTLTYSPD